MHAARATRDLARETTQKLILKRSRAIDRDIHLGFLFFRSRTTQEPRACLVLAYFLQLPEPQTTLVGTTAPIHRPPDVPYPLPIFLESNVEIALVDPRRLGE